MTDPDAHARAMAATSTDDPTGWFEQLYAQARAGEAVVPWDSGTAHFLLREWTRDQGPAGAAHALVVGCGPGRDAEHIAACGYDTVAFDVSETAVQTARERHPDSAVRYTTADLLDPPAEWFRAFDLVIESLTVQSLPVTHHQRAIRSVTELVAPGGRLLVISSAAGEHHADGPPWPLTRTEIDAFGTDGLHPVLIEDLQDADDPAVRRWRAEFTRSRTE